MFVLQSIFKRKQHCDTGELWGGTELHQGKRLETQGPGCFTVLHMFVDVDLPSLTNRGDHLVYAPQVENHPHNKILDKLTKLRLW